MNITIFPLDKVEIDGVAISLGMKRNAVEELLGVGEFVGKRIYYYCSDMAIDYHADNKVEFIEF